MFHADLDRNPSPRKSTGRSHSDSYARTASLTIRARSSLADLSGRILQEEVEILDRRYGPLRRLA